jgi:tripartite-type tricarboxylate transporter receptor subunit TctC
MKSLKHTLGLLIAVALPLAAQAAYPDKPIRLIVPYAAGGPTDSMARILQAPLQKALGGATVIVENVTGVSGALAAQQVLRAPADGYTLFLGNNGPSAVTRLRSGQGLCTRLDGREIDDGARGRRRRAGEQHAHLSRLGEK